MIEEWKDLPDYKGSYQVSNLGRVKSIKFNKNRILKTNSKNKGYKVVCLSAKGKTKVWQVHQLVAISFLNHIPNGHKLVVDHLDNNKLNNVLSNLQIITNRKNVSKESRGISKYVGVNWDIKLKKWKAQIRVGKNHIYLGTFEKELDAANAYKNKLNIILTK